MTTQFDFPENALTLHFLFQDTQSLFNIIVANDNFHCFHLLSKSLILTYVRSI